MGYHRSGFDYKNGCAGCNGHDFAHAPGVECRHPYARSLPFTRFGMYLCCARQTSLCHLYASEQSAVQ
eukprot:3281433-Amphidinium_carterae.1